MKFRQIVPIIVILLSAQNARAQAYKTILFEGGAMQGIAHFGAIAVLDSAGILNSAETYGGTSSGAIMATMLSLGYSVNEIEYLLYSVKWEEFNDGAFALMSGSVRLPQRYGWLPGNNLRAWLEEILTRKTAISGITFRQLDSLKKFHRNFKNLKIAATCINTMKAAELSVNTFPNMKISDAVYASCAIPIYFEPLRINKTGQKITEVPAPDSAWYFADGGLVASFPAFLGKNTSGRILGLLLEIPLNISGPDSTGNGFPIHNFNDYMEKCYYAVIENQQDTNMNKQLTELKIQLIDCNPRIRKMKAEEITEIINQGKLSARHFLSHKKD